MICAYCETEVDESHLNTIHDGDVVCDDCLDSHYSKCESCEYYHLSEDMYSTFDGNSLCVDCEDDYFCCDSCGGRFISDDSDCYTNFEECEYLCPNCNNGSSVESKNNNEHQSRNYGSIIKSKRTFGVELELLTNSNLRGEIDGSFGIKGDASLNTDGTDFNDTIEVVSPILRGKRGEDALIGVCQKLREFDVGINESCGLHVHLGAKDFLSLETVVMSVDDVKRFKEKDEYDMYTAFYIPSEKFSKIIVKDKDNNDLDRLISYIFNGDYNRCKFVDCEEGFHYNDKSFDSDTIKDTDTVIMKVLDDNFMKLKNLLKFYLVFEPVIMDSQPDSRRDSNSFSAPINNSFNLTDLEQVKSYKQLDEYWYKTSDKRDIQCRKDGNYSSARYFSFNFHSLLRGINGSDKGFKTFEVRVHSGTKNAKKILHWTAFHQSILDKISSGKITTEQIDKASGVFSKSDKMGIMFKMLELKEPTQKYMEKRIKKFGEKIN